MNNMRLKLSYLVTILFSLVSVLHANNTDSKNEISGDITFRKGELLGYNINTNENEVVFTALDIFKKDFKQVFDADLTENQQGSLIIGTIGSKSLAEQLCTESDIRELKSKREGFLIRVQDNKLIILGNDKRGTAYGILELSRLIGVSPWEWWADSPVLKKDVLKLKNGFRLMQAPSVKHRGFFLNDEDWGLTPWSYKNFEPSKIKGQIGPKTHARIFELLLRLRANTFWPAMHECSVAFYLTPGNKEMADKYGIYVGSSHCEPMMRNTNAEWKHHGTGEYNYLTNRDNILKFWEERTRDLAGSDNLYTLGIRGVHDGKMQGANTVEEQKQALTQILKDQREMIKSIVNPDIEKVSQVFIPYKEVLDVYNAGLEVPEDVSLMWCDDNYGYINHFPDSIERNRKGGNGIYYHISYWGRPHDYLWLATTSPALVNYQMKLAWEKGARDMWIINVGDIKPGEYLLELLMDLAWNIHTTGKDAESLDSHLRLWLSREFGKKYAGELTAIMQEYYRLSYIRKPEFMGNTRTEEKDPAYKIVRDLPWSENEILQRLSDYQKLERKVKKISENIPVALKDTWYQLIEYPVRASSQMNSKILYAQLARHDKVDWQLSDAAFDEIKNLTVKYNSLNNGKWKHMMDEQPRELNVFMKIPQEKSSKPLPVREKPLQIFNGTDYKSQNGDIPVNTGLGYERKAIAISQNSSVSYPLKIKKSGEIKAIVALVPNHPVSGKTIRFAISIDGEQEQIFDIKTHGRSEEWKMNVLSNQAIRTATFNISKSGNKQLIIRAIDEGIVLDQVKVVIL